MKITQEVRDYAAAQELAAQDSEAGMQQKAAEFRETGSQLYHEAKS